MYSSRREKSTTTYSRYLVDESYKYRTRHAIRQCIIFPNAGLGIPMYFEGKARGITVKMVRNPSDEGLPVVVRHHPGVVVLSIGIFQLYIHLSELEVIPYVLSVDHNDGVGYKRHCHLVYKAG